MHPKISVIVPVYKVEPYLKMCIDSILAQTFTDFELILVNDGSPDRCGIICDRYAKKDSRITVIHKENGGLSSARNAGIKIARGKYIGFVDSDDYIDKKMYEILYDIAELHSSDVVLCDFKKVNVHDTYSKNMHNNDLHISHYSNIEALYQLYPQKQAVDMVNEDNDIKWIIICNKLYKREIFEKLIFKEGRIHEDEFIIHQILYNCKKVTYIAASLYYYVQSPNSIMRSIYTKRKLDKVYALKERADYFMKIEEDTLLHLAYKSFLESFFWNYFTAKLELKNDKQELKQLKNTFASSISLLLINPLIGWKQKIYCLLFVINPFN
ncbi:glycosyltransferase family 2 protein [Lederbergia citri]|uniref:Glycosyltransferase n=1 Tax=Lederbergia citri TaxID=2833580 RepID=A0A942TGJ4_9BACI|nr:glycosyltransferase [Lederbergia citri]MBS4197580.1 glycosyltransferase [Lederbergia citri]